MGSAAPAGGAHPIPGDHLDPRIGRGPGDQQVAAGDPTEQLATGTLVVLLVLQVVVLKPLADVGPDTEHVATGTLLVLLGVQVISVHWFDDAADCCVHVATPVAFVTSIGQVVSVQLFDAWAGSGLQVPVGTPRVELTLQVRVV